MVESTTRCGHHNVCATTESIDLSTDVLTAVDRNATGAQMMSVLVDRFRHLHREFARGHEYQSLHRGTFASHVQAIQDRQSEGRRLAGAGGCLTQEVSALDERRNRFALNRCWFLVAESG